MKRKRILVILTILFIAGFTFLGISNLRNQTHQLQLKEIKLKNVDNQLKLERLKTDKLQKELNNGEAKSQAEIDRLNKELEERKKNEQRLEAELQAKLQRKEQERIAAAQLREKAVNAVTGTQTASASSGSIDCNNPATAKAFIYCKESGNNPNAVNSTGCRGIGQACPGSKLPCSGSDYACQDAWFTSYMQQRYGSWEAAKAHWLARVPINGVDVGHWW